LINVGQPPNARILSGTFWKTLVPKNSVFNKFYFRKNLFPRKFAFDFYKENFCYIFLFWIFNIFLGGHFGNTIAFLTCKLWTPWCKKNRTKNG
jgi:hypothetical protein